MSAGNLAVNLIAHTGRFKQDMRNASNTVTGFAGKIKSLTMGTTMGRMFTVGGLLYGLQKSVSLAKEGERAQLKLAQALKASGGAAGYSTKELASYAKELQKVTNYSTRPSMDAMAMMATFTEIRGPVFKDAIEMAMNLSETLGTDLRSSVIQLGKALNDPILGLTAMTRSGVSFSAQQKEEIKALANAGKMVEAQRMMLKVMKEQGLEGMARALADPLDQAKNSLEDIAATLGEMVIPALEDAAKVAIAFGNALEFTRNKDAPAWLKSYGKFTEFSRRWGTGLGLAARLAEGGESKRFSDTPLGKAYQAKFFPHGIGPTAKMPRDVPGDEDYGPGGRMIEADLTLGDLPDEFKQRGRKIWEDTRTDLEKFKREVQDLTQLFKMGAIPELETYNRALMASAKSYQDTLPKPSDPGSLAASMQYRSLEAYSMIANLAYRQDVASRQLSVEERQAKTLDDILRELQIEQPATPLP